ncbi:hypothetical protein DFH06DRAFT_1148526 [Mycena polygramma]|nr:hypothetical protein DFH06DRAFT_1148526 [Mycena polygramma]
MNIQQKEKHPKAGQSQYGRSAHQGTRSQGPSNPGMPLDAQLQTMPPSGKPPQTDDPPMPQWMSTYLNLVQKMHPPEPLQYKLPVLPNTKDWMYWPPLEYLNQLPTLPDDILEHIITAQVPQAILRSEGRTLGPYCNFHPPIDFVPFEKWGNTEIPETSPLYSLWRARDWKDWDGYRRLCTLPLYLTRSQAGLKIREGFGVPGRIIPIAPQSDYGDHNMIFTTTANTKAILHAAGRRASGVGQDAVPRYSRCACGRHTQADSRRHGSLARGGKWWDIFQKDESLRPLLTLFAPLVAYEKKIEEDPNWVPTKEYLLNNPLEYSPRR